MVKKKNTWEFSSPKFEFLANCQDFTWFGHCPFAYDLVQNIQPKSIVELGTFKGTSLYSFTQSVKDAQLETQLFAVDAWEGDANTGYYNSGDFTVDLYTHVSNTLQTFYPEQRVKLMKMWFIEAREYFVDKSIDILHIDGLHTYEAVKEDYETWKDKVSDDGVILFHDILVPEFGVKELWAEIKSAHPEYFYLDFPHHSGLGVLIKSQKVASLFESHTKEALYDHYINQANLAITSADILRVQGERDRLFYDYQWFKNESYTALIKNNELLAELNRLNSEYGAFYATFFEYWQKIGVKDLPSIIDVLNDWNFRGEVIHQLERELDILRNFQSRRSVRLLQKVDNAPIIRNSYVRKAIRLSLKPFILVKRVLGR